MPIIAAPLARPLSVIAEEIGANWRDVRNAGSGARCVGRHPAHDYWSAMRTLRGLDDWHGWVAGTDVVRGFLLHSCAWSGPTAERIRGELRSAVAWQHQQERAPITPRYV